MVNGKYNVLLDAVGMLPICVVCYFFSIDILLSGYNLQFVYVL